MQALECTRFDHERTCLLELATVEDQMLQNTLSREISIAQQLIRCMGSFIEKGEDERVREKEEGNESGKSR